MPNLRRTIGRLLVLAAVVAAVLGPVRALGADPLEIMAILPLTGQGAFTGREYVKGLTALEGYVNRTGEVRGRPLKIVLLDDQSSPQQAVVLVNQAIAKKVAVIIGPGSASECGAVVSLVKDGPVSYCLSPGIHPEAGSYMYSADFSTVDLAAVAVKYARERGYKRIALIANTDASGQDGERSIDAALADPANKAVTVVDREHFATADLSVAAQVTRIRAASPQAVIAWASGTPFGTFLRNAHEVGLDVPVLTTPANQTYEQMATYADILPTELLFCTGPFSSPELISDRSMRTAVDALYDSLRLQNTRPGFGAQSPWDPGFLIVSALRKLGPDATAAQIHEYLSSLKGWVGENGRYDFTAVPQRGIDGASAIMARWDRSRGTWRAASKLGGMPLP